ncbi:BamA/TamA family outer membrane protein [Myroides marinus]|uniref:translocation and assembly module lipoprotein TamL n=1 Tax=Myroides marinus TaxID=703342 RepID=UPI002577FA56|nr:BamA/TamA family outer membrane protein [Myroides marinus]MDM1369293.1 BamA/TamA family outer membrane protein [Myroides marinus]MDM1376137.1 BamA/TamA family outer membrane protein [Myroides marinus]MDM1383457.1 BamA/TamA family outer membrane protein [Myroides marinus]
MRLKQNKLYNGLIGCVVFLSLFSCNSTRHLGDDEYLYSGAKLVFEGDSLSKAKKSSMNEELSSLMRPVPNASIFGFHSKLFFYNLAGDPEKSNKLRRWMRDKMGEPPVLFDQVDVDKNTAILSNRLENQGYFNVNVSHDTLIPGDKKKGIQYTIKPGDQYRIREFNFAKDSTDLSKNLSKAMRFTRLKKGRAYDLDQIKEERTRFDNYLKNKGYYFFSADNLLVQVDSTVGKHEVDLRLKVKDNTPKLALEPYTIDNIYIFSDYVLSDGNAKEALVSAQKYKDFTIVDPKGKFKPSIYDKAIHLKSGETYNRNDHNLSLNRLVSLGVFKFVKNQFEISDSLNHKLDAYYFLTPDNPKALRLELLGKMNSASYNGAELNLNWSNKNFFKGAEVFSVSAYGGADFQMSSANNGYNVYKVGLETSLTWPKIISPFNIESTSAYIPKTRATLGGEYLERSQLYSLQSFKASWGYLWKENAFREHDLKILDINYVKPGNVTDYYKEYAAGNPSLERVLDKQLTFGPTYTYTYTNTSKRFKKSTIYYRGSLDLSGNITGLLMGANADKDKEKSIIGVPFSQYVKTEHDFRHYLKLGKTSQLVSRIHAGVGVAYGNSQQMPYTKQFYVGGSNSIRAFRARTIGPGSFDPSINNAKFIPDQSGDMLIEMNLEYRKKLFSIVHGALFVDAGNIWNLNEVSDRPGGKFSGDFMNEFAVGAGAGLRFDITFLVVRFDFAFPLRVPYNQPGDRWVVDDIKFGDSKWRKDNLMFNFAIGYPF